VRSREKLGARAPSQHAWLLDSGAHQSTNALVETAREPGHAEVATRPGAAEPAVTALSVPLVAIATALTVLVFAFGVRRLIGLPLSFLRALAAGREPLAAASIAQVHAATLRSGARVVVKVRRPDVTRVLDRDLDIVARLAARLQRSTSWG
jgi:ABC1 atypical kinase-like domain